jgi:hypothetical protein
MDKYKYYTHEQEKLILVKADKVWLKEDLLHRNSIFRLLCPGVWTAIDKEEDLKLWRFCLDLKDIKCLITNSKELFVIYITTESEKGTGKKCNWKIVYLTNKNTFIDITLLMAFTDLVGCRTHRLNPQHEDFVAEFVGDVFF